MGKPKDTETEMSIIDSEMIIILSKNIASMMKEVSIKGVLRSDEHGTSGDGGDGGDAGDGDAGVNDASGGNDCDHSSDSSVGKMMRELSDHVFVELTKCMIAKSKAIQHNTRSEKHEAGLSTASKGTVKKIGADVCNNIHACLVAPSAAHVQASLQDASFILNDLEVCIRAKKNANALACVSQLRSKLSI